MLGDCWLFARREPGIIQAGAFAAGLLVNLLPARWVAGTFTVLDSALIRPTLMPLVSIKTFELCFQNKPNPHDCSPPVSWFLPAIPADGPLLRHELNPDALT